MRAFSFLEYSWNPSQATEFFSGFLTQRLNYFLHFSSCDHWRDFHYSNYPHWLALRQYRHMSSSRQIHILNSHIALMVEMGIFSALAIFLWPLSILCASTIFCRTSGASFIKHTLKSTSTLIFVKAGFDVENCLASRQGLSRRTHFFLFEYCRFLKMKAVLAARCSKWKNLDDDRLYFTS